MKTFRELVKRVMSSETAPEEAPPKTVAADAELRTLMPYGTVGWTRRVHLQNLQEYFRDSVYDLVEKHVPETNPFLKQQRAYLAYFADLLELNVQYEWLRSAVNESPEECGPECADGYHGEPCPRCDPAIWLERQQAELHRWRAAEQALGAAYLRLRTALNAFDTPTAPTAEQVWERTEAALTNVLDANRGLRRLLFLAHGDGQCVLYGDDGELTCNSCVIDFKRDPVATIEHRIFMRGLKRLADAQAAAKE